MLRKTAAILFPVILVLILVCGCGGAEDQEAGGETQEEEYAEIPSEYGDLYTVLEGKLGEIDSYLDQNWDGEVHDTVFGGQLNAADSHRGEELLSTEAFEDIVDSLDSIIQCLGRGGLTLNIYYPVISPSNESAGEYLDFYRRLATEIKDRGFKLIVATTNAYCTPTYNPLNVDYTGFTLDQYKQEKRLMVETIIRELQPDYLTIENEPTTQQGNVRLAFPPDVHTDIVNYVLNGLDRGATRIGVGLGTWEDLSYAESLAANTSVDFISMHIYPIQGDRFIDRAIRIAETARSNGKGVAVDEAWLYKLSQNEMISGVGWEEAFRRDAYSFWAPLDEMFLTALVKLSHYLEMEFISPIECMCYFYYIDYDPSCEDLDYTATAERQGQQTTLNLQAGILTTTGEKWQELTSGSGL